MMEEILTLRLDMAIGCGARNFNQEVFFESLNEGYRIFDLNLDNDKSIVMDCIKQIEIKEKEEWKHLITKSPRYKDIKFVLKLWINELGSNRTADYEARSNDIELNCLKLIKDLKINCIDTLLIHWPLQVNKSTNTTEEFIIEEIWPQFESLVTKGFVLNIGVSNFGLIELQKLFNMCRIKPSVNQIEVNPYNNNKVVCEFCLKNGVVVMGHSSFSFGWVDNHKRLLSEPILIKLAEKYNVPVSCVILKWAQQNNIIPVVGTSSVEHLREYNLVDNITIVDKDLEKIDLLNEGTHLYADNYKIHYLDYYPHFSFEKQNILVGTERNANLKTVATNDTELLKKCRESLTIGPGFIIIEKLIYDYLAEIRNNVPPAPKIMDESKRWNGHGEYDIENSLINQHPIYTEIINNNLIGLIVDNLLGWDCKLDNIAFSISRTGKLSNFFGPHQDSPFEQNPGAILPPCEYPMGLQVLLAVDDFTEDNGCFFAIPYSHKKRLRVNLSEQGNQPKGILPKDAVLLKLKAGDICIASSNIWHGALPNKTDKDRRSILIEFVSSVIEPRDRFNENNIKKEIWSQFPARVIRLLYGGRERFHSPSTLREAWRTELIKNKVINTLNTNELT
jgi:diketogulonate reductase-like aldo/keto reductase